MKFSVSHVTHYRYDRPVFLEPHTLRLMPRSGGSQRVLSYSLRLSPRPAGVTEILDAENNASHYAWFEESADELVVNSSFEVETLRTNPFDFILADLTLATLPIVYPDSLLQTLTPYFHARTADRSVYAYARAVAQEVEWQTVPFLSALNRKLYTHIDHNVREEGAAQAASETLAVRRGACRDVAVLFIEACRSMGLAARFISGYELTESQKSRVFMHAWAEVFLPGGGWRGYDPSRGLATAANHIAVASSCSPELAAPVSGSFRGSGALSRMDFEIQMTPLEPTTGVP